MAKVREIACIHYKYHGCCDLGKNADFYGHCQTCPTYSAKKGGRPARVDRRKQKQEKINKKELKNYVKYV